MKATGFIEKRASRRGFLIGSALAGSAVAVSGHRLRDPSRAPRTRRPPGVRRGRSAPTATRSSAARSTRRTQHVPARLVRRRMVARRSLELLRWRHPLLHRLHAGLLRPRASAARSARACTAVPVRRTAAARARCTATTSATGSATRRSRVGADRVSRRHVRPAVPRSTSSRAVPPPAVDNSTAEHAGHCLPPLRHRRHRLHLPRSPRCCRRQRRGSRRRPVCLTICVRGTDGAVWFIDFDGSVSHLEQPRRRGHVGYRSVVQRRAAPPRRCRAASTTRSTTPTEPVGDAWTNWRLARRCESI